MTGKASTNGILVRFGVREWVALGLAAIAGIVGWRMHEHRLTSIAETIDSIVATEIDHESRITTIEAGRYTSEDAMRDRNELSERLRAIEQSDARLTALLETVAEDIRELKRGGG